MPSPNHDVIYDVAVSADGFIAGQGDDISAFPASGNVVDDYLARLQGYGCALMGRRTYEFGYGFGMKPGQNPYPHMQTHVFSASIDLPPQADVTVHRDNATLRTVIAGASGPVYLCGGGAFAGSLAKLGLIDRLILKRAPMFLGRGIRLFDGYDAPVSTDLVKTQTYGCGVILQEFRVRSRR